MRVIKSYRALLKEQDGTLPEAIDTFLSTRHIVGFRDEHGIVLTSNAAISLFEKYADRIIVANIVSKATPFSLSIPDEVEKEFCQRTLIPLPNDYSEKYNPTVALPPVVLLSEQDASELYHLLKSVYGDDTMLSSGYYLGRRRPSVRLYQYLMSEYVCAPDSSKAKLRWQRAIGAVKHYDRSVVRAINSPAEAQLILSENLEDILVDGRHILIQPRITLLDFELERQIMSVADAEKYAQSSLYPPADYRYYPLGAEKFAPRAEVSFRTYWKLVSLFAGEETSWKFPFYEDDIELVHWRLRFPQIYAAWIAIFGLALPPSNEEPLLPWVKLTKYEGTRIGLAIKSAFARAVREQCEKAFLESKNKPTDFMFALAVACNAMPPDSIAYLDHNKKYEDFYEAWKGQTCHGKDILAELKFLAPSAGRGNRTTFNLWILPYEIKKILSPDYRRKTRQEEVFRLRNYYMYVIESALEKAENKTNES